MSCHTDGPIGPPPDRVTTGLALTLSEGFRPEDAEAARAGLREHLKVDQLTFVAQLSADPNLVSFIRAIGDIATWLPLSAAATVYLSTLAKHAADATWDAVRSRFARKEVKPLADVAKTLAATASKVKGEVHIFVGLDIPDDYWGTCVCIRGREPMEIARKMAAFVVHIEELSLVMHAEIEAGRGPLGGAIVEVQDDGSLRVKWRAMADFKDYERIIP